MAKELKHVDSFVPAVPQRSKRHSTLVLSTATRGNDPIPWEALSRCQQGDSLLKFVRSGDPHFRNFKISSDFDSIEWRSKGKDNRVLLADVRNGKGFLSGNLNGLFKRNTKKRYDARVCFSLDYTTKTLDVVCSDTDQYHAWSQSIIWLLKYGKPSEDLRPESKKYSQSGNKEDKGEGEGGDDMSTRVVSNNDVYTWGFGGQGQLGHNGTSVSHDVTTPLVVRHMLAKKVLGIATGLEHVVAMVKPGE